ncbi:MAG: UDP-N-acetylglucosamine 2-epimerase (non-hydrolyzing) [Chlamydiota bacterium]
MKICCIVGARPQFVKVAALTRKIKSSPLIIHTGQHYEENMSSVFFDEMQIPKPKYHLEIGGLPQGAMTGKMIEEIEKVFFKEKPDCVIVFGDTNSTLAGAIAASKLHIPIGHVEAGLRSYNRKMPEEINRVLTDHCSDLLFTPTQVASQTLIDEGIDPEKIHHVGDIMYDIALFYQEQIGNEKEKTDYVLATIHRAENTDDPDRLRNIFEQLVDLSKGMQVKIPLHPRTKLALKKIDLLDTCQRALHVMDPLGYLDMIRLESNAKLIITDSGGVQKEAFFFKVPCITMRTETEWIELVERGFNKLVSPYEKIDMMDVYHEMTNRRYQWDVPLYGNGTAADQIIGLLTVRDGRRR